MYYINCIENDPSIPTVLNVPGELYTLGYILV